MKGLLNLQRDVPCQMRDGVKLYADIYTPEGPGPFPLILMRLPYDKTQGQSYVYNHPAWFSRQGYIVVVQDTRGRWKSEGEFYPLKHEMEDGYDSVEWASRLPGCNGKVGMYGFSYAGVNQLMAAALKPPHLACICPMMAGSEMYEGWLYNGGALSLAFAVSWAVELALGEAHRRGDANLEREICSFTNTLRSWYGYLPLDMFPILKENGLAPYFFDWLEHPCYDDYWKEWSLGPFYSDIHVPSLFGAGWYDVFCDGIFNNYLGFRQQVDAEVARQKLRLIVGPWFHVPWVQWMGDLNFGDEARNTISELHLQWFDYWLKGRLDQLLQEQPVRVFITGENNWWSGEGWPPAGMREENFYFHSYNGANSLTGDGKLSLSVPEEEPFDIFVYDPRSPVPSLGGHSCCFTQTSPMGPVDQRPVELQNQVLIYTSDVLTEGMLVGGPVKTTLWAASSAVDTDFTVKLVDVHPDGKAINIKEGILRARYRDSLEQPRLMKPGEIYNFKVQVGNVCHRFLPGHRIRVEISSSNFPHWDRNTNSGNIPALDSYTSMVVATQFLFHDSDRPSHISLPLIYAK